ncbi:hypothetical protein EUX98_g375 [Antrodiella citrinella]|uniref:Uncharacterized protein n=1 Tax=Antrodiella citrinella TaxID=2447956 RepID=A0A4S4N6H8_9APHY|nr:hypothetical protein EUX98_g375 [Antrodiella citrinella]
MATWSGIPTETSELAQKVVQANKDHQYALKVYTERLEAELEAVDKLLTVAEQSDEEPEVDAGGNAVIPDSMKAVGPFEIDARLEDSYFAAEADTRRRYLKNTVIHPMKTLEIDALSDAVKAELHRTHAHTYQHLGHPSDSTLNLYAEIDWNRVATRTYNAQRPSVKFAGVEIIRIRELVGTAKEGEVDWVDVARILGTGRTPIDCMRHAIARKTHVWTPQSDALLLEAVRIYGTGSWMLVARMVSDDATASQCQSRYTRTLDPSLVRGTWTEEQDTQLRNAVDVYGHSWTDVCNFVSGRSSEQCRDRWQEFLSPTVSRTKWSESEDQALLETIEQIGEGRWKEISRVLNNGRTDSMCRSRYTALMKRKQKGTSESASPAPSDMGTTASRTATPNIASSSQQPPLSPVGAAASGAEIAPTVKPRRKPRGKSALQQDSNAHPEEPATPVATSKKPAARGRKSRLAASSVADEAEFSAAATSATTETSGRGGRKRAAPISADAPSTKKRKTAKSNALVTTNTADDDPQEAPVEEQVKRPRPKPRMVTRKFEANAVATTSDGPTDDVEDPLPLEGTSHAPTTTDTQSPSAMRKPSGARRKVQPPATPARKSARLANKPAGAPPDIGIQVSKKDGTEESDVSSALSSVSGSPPKP